MKRKGIDSETKNWIRNASDELAAKNGCRFDPERALYTVNWIEKYCCLYEGEDAGKPLNLMDDPDWQRPTVMRLFGWVRHSDDWGREVRRFRRGSVWVPKKNKKSPTLAAIGVYLFAGDGEKGQKVFSCARDGKQAMIAHTHAMEMVRRSEELKAECKINGATGAIVHLPTRSVYGVINGDNIESQEGLNGSLLVDETHVVDRRLMKRLEYMGISRSEPLHLEFSTAGDNPDGYGKSECDRGLKVERAEPGWQDDSYFFAYWGAPAEITDDELDKNIVAVGRKANPAWGHTVKEGEFVSSYKRARNSLSDLATFKMYRLNIWQQSSNPWLRMSDWDACKEDFTEDDLAGQTCWAGLDLSRKRDMSALVLVFKGDEDTCRLLPYFWLPEEQARKNAHLAPFLQWAHDGHLMLTPGSAVDYGYIKSTFRRLAEKFNMAEVWYDETYANELTQDIEQGEQDDAGKTIIEGLGIKRVVFPQTMRFFACPTAEFERRVIKHTMHHNGHPVLSWQIGHTEVKSDNNANQRPVKPNKDSIQKIDGVVASIMGFWGAMQSQEETSVYDQRAARGEPVLLTL